MKLDRHELHVLNELKERYGWKTDKIKNLASSHKVEISYEFVEHEIFAQLQIKNNVFWGEAKANKIEPKYIERIGRMVAFGKAVANYLGRQVSGNELYDIAHGESSIQKGYVKKDDSNLIWGW